MGITELALSSAGRILLLRAFAETGAAEVVAHQAILRAQEIAREHGLKVPTKMTLYRSLEDLENAALIVPRPAGGVTLYRLATDDLWVSDYLLPLLARDRPMTGSLAEDTRIALADLPDKVALAGATLYSEDGGATHVLYATSKRYGGLTNEERIRVLQGHLRRVAIAHRTTISVNLVASYDLPRLLAKKEFMDTVVARGTAVAGGGINEPGAA